MFNMGLYTGFAGMNTPTEPRNVGLQGYYYDGTDTTFTATGSNGFKLEAGCEIRMAVASGTPSALYVRAYRI